ncbi:MAG: DUF892 family protein [Chitinophagaceae bacterium]
MAASSSKKPVAKATPKQNVSETVNKLNPMPGTDANTSVMELFVAELKDTLWAENHLVNALPKMVAAAGSKDLKRGLADHQEITKTHAARLEEILELLGEKIVAKKCDAMEGLTMSGEHVIENTIMNSPTRDLGIIMSGLKVENFEITTYKGLIQVANSLGKTDVVGLLQQTLDEEIESSNMLTKMSQSLMSNQPA